MLAKVLDNVNTITGKNVAHIQDMIGSKNDILNISSTELKKRVTFCNLDQKDSWRIGLIREITDIKHNKLQFQTPDGSEDSFLTNDQLSDIVNIASTS